MVLYNIELGESVKREAEPESGCNVGAGLVTLMAVKAFGADAVAITDIKRDNLDLAMKLGADVALNPDRDAAPQEVATWMRAALPPNGPDIVIDCAGFEPTLQVCRNANTGAMVARQHQQMLASSRSAGLVRLLKAALFSGMLACMVCSATRKWLGAELPGQDSPHDVLVTDFGVGCVLAGLNILGDCGRQGHLCGHGL